LQKVSQPLKGGRGQLTRTSGKYPSFEKMVTSRISLEDVVTKGFKELIENKDEHVKILVTPKKKLLK
jgi:threonine dehydrogenase-like Zn-dependent dehydrogenase